jgi:hypothetical protein
MIVISSSVVLSPDDDTNGNNPVIGWEQLVTASNVSATTEAATWPARNLADPSTYDRWEGLVGSPAVDEYLQCIVDRIDPVDYVGLARHNFGTAQIPVSIEAKATSGDPFTEIMAPQMFGNDAPIIFRFAPVSYYALRVRLQPGLQAPRCAVLYVGKLLIMPRRIYVGHTPINYGRATRVYNGRSERGHFMGRRILQESVETGATFQNILPSFYREHLEPFVQNAQQYPFFWAWRPQSYPNEVGYCFLTSDAKPVNQRANGMMQLQLDMAGVV